MLYLPGFTGGFEVVQSAGVVLHETFVEGVTVVVGVVLGEVVTLVPETVVASLPDVAVLDPPEVELALGEVVAAGGTELVGAGVVLEASVGFAAGFFTRDAAAFALGAEFNPTTLRLALSTLDKRFFSTSVKVLSLL